MPPTAAADDDDEGHDATDRARELRADVLATWLVGLAGVVALSSAAGHVLVLSARHTAAGALCFCLIGLVALGASLRHHPFARFGAANRVTLLRAGLVAWLSGFLVEPPSVRAAAAVVAVSLVAVALDGVDGWLARRTRMASAFGARFDMEVDALLILILSVLVWGFERAGAWVLLSGLLRYAFVAAGRVWPWMRRALPPSVRRRAICVVQIGGLIIAMAPGVPPWGARLAAAAALAALAVSFAQDTVWLYRSDRREQVA